MCVSAWCIIVIVAVVVVVVVVVVMVIVNSKLKSVNMYDFEIYR